MTTVAVPFMIAEKATQSSASLGVSVGVSLTSVAPVVVNGKGYAAVGVTIPDGERWLWNNVGAFTAVMQGITDARSGRVQERSFAEYATDDDE